MHTTYKSGNWIAQYAVKYDLQLLYRMQILKRAKHTSRVTAGDRSRHISQHFHLLVSRVEFPICYRVFPLDIWLLYIHNDLDCLLKLPVTRAIYNFISDVNTFMKCNYTLWDTLISVFVCSFSNLIMNSQLCITCYYTRCFEIFFLRIRWLTFL